MTLTRRLFGSGHAYGEIRELLASARLKGLCLDLCCGAGVNFAGIRAAGFEPVGADRYPGRARGSGSSLVQLDFEQPLPFRDESIEAILCSEGIEHHPAQLFLLRECARVLKRGGLLVLTTPNVLNLRARFSTLLNGHYSFVRAPISEATQRWTSRDGGGSFYGHVFLISYFALRFLLDCARLPIARVTTAKYSRTSLLLAPFLWIPVWLGTTRLYRARMKQAPEVREAILEAVRSSDLLLGKKLIVAAIKADKLDAPPNS